MLRALFKSDLPQVLAIEQSVHISPWTEETFRTCFEAEYLGWVMEVDKKVIGFIVLSLRVDECHVLNIGIARDYQHQGCGRKLLEYALRQVKYQGASIAYLEVRRSNARAIAMYRKMKFHLVGERKGYYPSSSPAGNEDALIFAKSLHEDIPS